MKVGIFGGVILLILTIVFSFMAIQNNKIARQITVNSFNLTKQKHEVKKFITDKNSSSHNISKKVEDGNMSRVNKTKAPIANKNNWQNFDDKFKDFDSKFKNF